LETLEIRQRSITNLDFWLPALAGGLFAWMVFITLGETPFIRASGLALAIAGVILTLRRMGPLLALAGGLALAFSPAFWSQTGGGASVGPATIVLATILAGISAAIFIHISRRPYLALGVGLLIFAIIYWSQIGVPRSLRLTSLMSAWLLFLLVDALHISNPRPDEPPAFPIKPQQYIALLLILYLGVLNDPLFVLLAPAVALGLWLSHTPLPRWYWLGMLLGVVIGIWGVMNTYVAPVFWSASALEAHITGLQTRYIIPDGWREGLRWVNVLGIVVNQLTIIGAGISILGLARMARWYPVLGVVLMIAYACYAIFGLVYFGGDRDILLLPLFVIQIIWLTYGIYTFSQWLANSPQSLVRSARWPVIGLYFSLPVYFLIKING
jgi:hypothetical protein